MESSQSMAAGSRSTRSRAWEPTSAFSCRSSRLSWQPPDEKRRGRRKRATLREKERKWGHPEYQQSPIIRVPLSAADFKPLRQPGGTTRDGFQPLRPVRFALPRGVVWAIRRKERLPDSFGILILLQR